MISRKSVDTMIFFNDGNHAAYSNAVVAAFRNRNFIFKVRFYAIAVSHIDAQTVAFFIYFQVDIRSRTAVHLHAGVNGILHSIRQ